VSFPGGSAGISFVGQTVTERSAWLQITLAGQQYLSLGKKEQRAVRTILVAGWPCPRSQSSYATSQKMSLSAN
jgi:hypothetical protein